MGECNKGCRRRTQNAPLTSTHFIFCVAPILFYQQSDEKKIFNTLFSNYVVNDIQPGISVAYYIAMMYTVVSYMLGFSAKVNGVAFDSFVDRQPFLNFSKLGIINAIV